MISVTHTNADGRTEPPAGAARLGEAVCADTTYVSGVNSTSGLAAGWPNIYPGVSGMCISTGTTIFSRVSISDNMAELRPS